eukprot:jgi/Chrzof1/5353/UNPLg00818.t1
MGKTAGPEHNHFSIVEARAKGDNKVQCNYCNYTFVGGDSRMRTHLLGDAPALGVQRCTACPPAVLAEMMQLAAEKDADANKKRKLAALDQASASVVASNASTVAIWASGGALGPPARVKNAKALVAPGTQVTRVQVPALTNFSGHTEIKRMTQQVSRRYDV